MMCTIGITGHRPDKLGGYNPENLFDLIDFASYQLSFFRRKNTVILTGMALGWDLAIAQACVNRGISFKAIIPFVGQDRLWTKENKVLYRTLLGKADKVINTDVFTSFNGKSIPRQMQDRNKYIVDNSSKILALWNGSSSGTANCINYARLKGKQIDNVWADWIKWRSL